MVLATLQFFTPVKRFCLEPKRWCYFKWMKPFLIIIGLSGNALADMDSIKTSISVDLLGSIGLNRGSNANDRLDLREGEILFFAPTDYRFDAVFSSAAHSEDGLYFFEVHEAYLKSSKLVPRLRFRIGQYFLGIGRLNRIHRHDWVFTLVPEVHRRFFDSNGEGVIDTGIEGTWLIPADFFLEWTFGLTNGWKLGHSHDVGEQPAVPTHYSRLATFASFSQLWGLEIGLNYLGRRSKSLEWSSHAGLDLVLKKKVGKTLEFLYQSELWVRRQKLPSLAPTENIGTYQFVEVGFDPAFSFGVRWDYFMNLSNFLNGNYIPNSITALAPQLTYRHSEFLVFRIGGQWEWDKSADRAPVTSQQVFLQTVFLLGAHPSHVF